MNKNKMIFLLLLMFIIGGAVGFNLNNVLSPAKKENISYQVQEESKNEEIKNEEVVSYKEISFLDSDAVYSAADEVLKEGKELVRDNERVILDGFDFRFLESLGIGKNRLETGLRQWCDLNGYTSVAGATFLPKLEMNVMDECLTFELFLHYSKEGNGIVDESKRHLSLRYFYIKDEFLIY